MKAFLLALILVSANAFADHVQCTRLYGEGLGSTVCTLEQKAMDEAIAQWRESQSEEDLQRVAAANVRIAECAGKFVSKCVEIFP
jgi:hypothetical protein